MTAFILAIPYVKKIEEARPGRTMLKEKANKKKKKELYRFSKDARVNSYF